MSGLIPVLVLAVVVLVAVSFVVIFRQNHRTQVGREQAELTRTDDARAEARRWIDRLGTEVLSTSGTDAHSTDLVGQASARLTAATTHLGDATSPAQARTARDIALEGLHLMRDARRAMGQPDGAPIPAPEERA